MQPLPQSRLNTSKYAQRCAYQGAEIFRQLGLKERATALEAFAKHAAKPPIYAVAPVPLPKPAWRPSGVEQQLVDQNLPVRTENQKIQQDLGKFEAQAISLSGSLNDLKDRRDRGRIDEGRYLDLRTSLDTDRIGILLEIQKTVEGKDQDIDDIVRDRKNGTDEKILWKRLAKWQRK